MKKIIVLFSLMLFSLHCFAAEFIISPAIGYSNIANPTNWSAEVGATKAKGDLDFSLNAMDLSIALGFITEGNGFTFIVNNDFAVAGQGTAKFSGNGGSLSFDTEKPFAWEMSVILGRTFKACNNKLYINIGAGPAFGTNQVSIYQKIAGKKEKIEDIFSTNFGARVQLGTQYFFAEKMGINFIIADTIAGADLEQPKETLGMTVKYDNPSFENIFTIKAGFMFRI